MGVYAAAEKEAGTWISATA